MQDSNIRPGPKIAAHSLPFPFVFDPRTTKQEGAEQNASFMRIWWMQASSRLDNPGLPSLDQGAAGVKATGSGGCNPARGRGLCQWRDLVRTGQLFELTGEWCQFSMNAEAEVSVHGKNSETVL